MQITSFGNIDRTLIKSSVECGWRYLTDEVEVDDKLLTSILEFDCFGEVFD